MSTAFWRALIGLDEAPSSAASTLAKHGASLRKDDQREKKFALA
jgi:hypothetical protein